jgi:hypothetical protein
MNCNYGEFRALRLGVGIRQMRAAATAMRVVRRPYKPLSEKANSQD